MKDKDTYGWEHSLGRANDLRGRFLGAFISWLCILFMHFGFQEIFVVKSIGVLHKIAHLLKVV